MIEGHDEGLWDFYTCKGPDNPADVFTLARAAIDLTILKGKIENNYYGIGGPMTATAWNFHDGLNI
eukprot:1410201-Prymnesium_polylepis.1